MRRTLKSVGVSVAITIVSCLLLMLEGIPKKHLIGGLAPMLLTGFVVSFIYIFPEKTSRS